MNVLEWRAKIGVHRTGVLAPGSRLSTFPRRGPYHRLKLWREGRNRQKEGVIRPATPRYLLATPSPCSSINTFLLLTEDGGGRMKKVVR